MTAANRLRPDQVDVLERWFPDHRVVADHSWSEQTLVVLELRTGVGDAVLLKASTNAAFDHHVDREARAHRMLGARLGAGFQTLLRHDSEERMIAFGFLPGTLVESSPWEYDPDVYRAAGRLLARLHAAASPIVSEAYAEKLRDRTRDQLRRAEGLVPGAELAAAAERLADDLTGQVRMVPTHGDFQPRNWLIDPDRAGDARPAVALIDLGRFDLRPWYSDLVRLHHQVFPDRPDLRAAVLDGMGRPTTATIVEPEEQGAWDLENLHQSIATLVWATDMGYPDFAGHGRSMLRRTLSQWGGAQR